jgi:hypothetical protein
MDIDYKLDRPALYFVGINILSSAMSLLVLVTSVMYYISVQMAGRIYKVDAITEETTKWSDVCKLSVGESSGPCLQYKLRFLIAIFGIFIGLLQFILSLLPALVCMRKEICETGPILNGPFINGCICRAFTTLIAARRSHLHLD